MNTCDSTVRVTDHADTTINVRQCTVDEVASAPNIAELMAEYVQEAHNVELPAPNAQWDYYRSLEQTGMLKAYAAFQDDKLIGFISLLCTPMPHHGSMLAVTESYFVASQYRKGGAGLRLLRAAEQCARDVGAPCLMVSAPHGGALEKIMPRLGYRHANSMFVRSVA